MVVVWPQYINSKLTINEGRKIPKESAVPDPSVNEIAKALKKLKYDFEIEKDKSYPGKWFEKSGRVLVDSEENKITLLKEIASKMK